uniref:NADP-dependent oxidoreductase domain-containing protein n=1 Tax=Parascaris equorum TaxID=6256 RepID=A0A914S1I9_PAREQ
MSVERTHYFKHKDGSYVPLVEDGRFAVDDVDYLDTWKALEKLHKQGKLKVEIHLYFPQKELREFCKARNITMTAYAPLGSPGRKAFQYGGFWPEGEPLKDPLVANIARKHKKTPAQVGYFYHLPLKAFQENLDAVEIHPTALAAALYCLQTIVP